MATGDLGGPVTELIITCRSAVKAGKGDPAVFIGAYRVTNDAPGSDVCGQYMQDVEPECAAQIKLRGVFCFRRGAHVAGFAGGYCTLIMDKEPGCVGVFATGHNLFRLLAYRGADKQLLDTARGAATVEVLI